MLKLLCQKEIAMYQRLIRNKLIILYILHNRYVGPKVAACPAYLQSNNSRESHGEDDAEYHYIPYQRMLR